MKTQPSLSFLMTDNVYKIVLLGKIADGFDAAIAHEQLASIFNIDIKKIPKLLKKPVVIRTNLKRDAALRYQTGLEKIGILCDIIPPLDSPPATVVNTEKPDIIIEDSAKPLLYETETFTLVDIKKQNTLILDGESLRVINIKMPFSSIMSFLIKWLFAAIVTIMIIGGISYVIWFFLGTQISDFIQQWLQFMKGL
jgi:hypothetical protein